VVALVAPTGTANTAALLPLVQESKLPLLFPYAFSHALTDPVKPYAFTTLPEVRVQARILAGYIVTALKQTKVAAIYQNDDFGQDAVIGLDERLAKEKVQLTKLPFDRGTTNFSGVVAQAKDAGVEHVVFLGIPRDAALVLKETAKIGWKPQFSGHSALGDPQTFQLAGAAVEGALAVAVMEPLDSDKPAVKAFIEAQKKQPAEGAADELLDARLQCRHAVRRDGEARRRQDRRGRARRRARGDAGLRGRLMGPISFSAQQHAGSLSGAMMKAENASGR